MPDRAEFSLDADTEPPALCRRVLDCSALYFTYPFAFPTLDFGGRVGEVKSASCERWASQDRSLPIWELAPLSSVRQYLLPHLADHLNPEDATPRTMRAPREEALKESGRASVPAGYVWALSRPGLRLLNKAQPFDAMEDGNRSRSSFVVWSIAISRQRAIPFRIKQVWLALFSAGAGSLTLEIEPDSEDLVDWLDLSHHFSKRRGAQLHIARPDDDTNVELRMKVPRLLETILDTCGQPDNDRNWWEEIFVADNLVPFPTLFVEESASQEDLRLIACRIRYGFSGEQHIDPDVWQLSDDSGEILHYSRQAVFVFSIDTAGFLCCGPPDENFWRSTLPNHLRNHYLLVLLLALAQRTALMKISRSVASSWRAGAAEEQHRELFHQISNDLLEFTARLHFVQAFHTEHYHAAYLRFRTAFRIAQLYEEVQDEVSQMSNQLEAESDKRRIEAERKRDGGQRRIERVIFLLTFFILPSQVILALFASKLRNWPGLQSWSPATTEIVAMSVILALLCAAAWWTRRARQTDGGLR